MTAHDPAIEAAQLAWDETIERGTRGPNENPWLQSIASAREALRPVRELHKPLAIMCLAPNCGAEVCDHEDECPVDHPVTVCAECWQIVELANSYYGEDGINGDLLWPCATARLIYPEAEL